MRKVELIEVLNAEIRFALHNGSKGRVPFARGRQIAAAM